MEALSLELIIGCHWELLYTNDIVSVAESLNELKITKKWRKRLEVKVKVSIGKTKVTCSRHDAHLMPIDYRLHLSNSLVE